MSSHHFHEIADAGISTTVHDGVQWYNALQQWTVRNVDIFWAATWHFFKIPSLRTFREAFIPGKVCSHTSLSFLPSPIPLHSSFPKLKLTLRQSDLNSNVPSPNYFVFTLFAFTVSGTPCRQLLTLLCVIGFPIRAVLHGRPRQPLPSHVALLQTLSRAPCRDLPLRSRRVTATCYHFW